MNIAPFSRVDRDASGQVFRVVPLGFIPAASIPHLEEITMNDATRTLIEMSLAVRSIEDTFVLFTRSMSIGVTKRDIVEIRLDMVSRGLLQSRTTGPNHYQNAEPIAGNDGVERSANADGCAHLLKAQLRTGQYFGKQRAEWLARHGQAA